MKTKRSFLKKGYVIGIAGAIAIVCLSLNTFAGSQLKDKYNSLIRSIAQKYRVEDKLIHSIIRAESNYNQWAVSSKGALGLMKLMPDTAVQYGVKLIIVQQGCGHLGTILFPVCLHLMEQGVGVVAYLQQGDGRRCSGDFFIPDKQV